MLGRSVVVRRLARTISVAPWIVVGLAGLGGLVRSFGVEAGRGRVVFTGTGDVAILVTASSKN